MWLSRSKKFFKEKYEHSNKIKKLKDKIRIDTVDSYQGKENLIALIPLSGIITRGLQVQLDKVFYLNPTDSM